MTLYTRYPFAGRSGYIVAAESAVHNLLTVRHSAGVAAWADADVHLHADSEEYYLLLQGTLRLWVAGAGLTLRPREMLRLHPGVPHAVLGGAGQIEHLGLRAPAGADRQSLGAAPADPPPPAGESERAVEADWGCRVPLDAAENCNCWLFGAGHARFVSRHLVFAWLDFPTLEAANAGLGTRHRLHLHQWSWEYYAVLRGTKTLQIEEELVEIRAGEILGVPPGVRHTLHSRRAPYQGFTLRVPLALDDKVEI